MKYKWLCETKHRDEDGRLIRCYVTHSGKYITDENHARWYNKRVQSVVNDINERRV